MTRATRHDEYTEKRAQWLDLAFELGVDEWKLGFTRDLGTTPRVELARFRGHLNVLGEHPRRGSTMPRSRAPYPQESRSEVLRLAWGQGSHRSDRSRPGRWSRIQAGHRTVERRGPPIAE
jgi:hypothetical protein